MACVVGDFQKCRAWDSNPHGARAPRDFKSLASASSATPACDENEGATSPLSSRRFCPKPYPQRHRAAVRPQRDGLRQRFASRLKESFRPWGRSASSSPDARGEARHRCRAPPFHLSRGAMNTRHRPAPVPGPVSRRASVARLIAVTVGLGWLTWPLARQLATHLPDTYLTCRFDGILPMWALAWETRALVEAPWRILEANTYHPAPHALAYGNMGFGALPLFAPVFLASGNPVLAMNATFLGGVALTAWGCGEVTARFTRSHAAAILAAATFLTTPFVFWSWIPTAPFYAALFYTPWILLLAAGRLRGARRVAML